MKIFFRDVKPGERFTTSYSMRMLTGVKVETTRVNDSECNVVILLDHRGKVADDLGTMIFQNDDLEVEVIR